MQTAGSWWTDVTKFVVGRHPSGISDMFEILDRWAVMISKRGQRQNLEICNFSQNLLQSATDFINLSLIHD